MKYEQVLLVDGVVAVEMERIIQYPDSSVKGDMLENFDDDPSWIDRHSVNCSKCSKLVDERECMPLEEGGSLCQACFVADPATGRA